MGECPTPEAPHQGKKAPPRAPSCRPHNAQSQLARACAAGLVTGPHAHTPPTHSKWVAGPGRTAQGRAVGRRRAPYPGRPTPSQEASSLPAPPSRPHGAQSQLARARAVGFLTGPHAHIPRTHSQWVTGPGRRPQGRAVRRGRAPNPGRPTPRQEAPPPGRPCAVPTTPKASSQERALWGR